MVDFTRFVAGGVAVGFLILAGCGGERAPLPGTEGAGGAPSDVGVSRQAAPRTPAPAAPVGGGTETGQALALKLEGIGSKAEMDAALARLSDPTVKGLFEQGFRLCFVQNKSQRDYPAARTAMEQVMNASPEFPPGYRVLAYCALNTGFDMAGSTALYEKAVEVDPEYGEAHYALSFMLTQFDVERGRMHFEKAMELGIPDERSLADKFYPAQ